MNISGRLLQLVTTSLLLTLCSARYELPSSPLVSLLRQQISSSISESFPISLFKRQRASFRHTAFRGGSSSTFEEFHIPNKDVPSPEVMLSPEETEECEVTQVVWNRHRRWSTVASNQKKRILFCRRASLALVVMGAGFNTLSFRVPEIGWAFSFLGGACVAGAPILRRTYLDKEGTLKWVRSRAASERIKAEVYTFRAGVSPYDGDDALKILVNKAAEISEDVKDLNTYYALTKTDGKPPPPKLDREGYMKYRIDSQIDGFYKKVARKQARILRNLKYCEAVFAFGSMSIAFIKGFNVPTASGASPNPLNALAEHIGLWGTACGTAAGGFATHLAASRIDEEIFEWLMSSQRLENEYLRLPKSVQPGSEEWTKFVLACEDIIAANTKQWGSMMENKVQKK